MSEILTFGSRNINEHYCSARVTEANFYALARVTQANFHRSARVTRTNNGALKIIPYRTLASIFDTNKCRIGANT